MISRKKEFPVASLSIDLDDKWTYLKSNSDKTWKNYPSYLEWVVPRILSFLKENRMNITFFLVGKDAEFEKNHHIFRKIVSDGHEIGNHSYNHDQWMAKFSQEKILAEIVLAEKKIEHATGKKPVGYRGPGYSFSSTIAKVLMDRNYLYDGSLWSTFIGPISYYFFLMTSNFRKLNKDQRSGLFGSWRDGFQPNKPFSLEGGSKRLLEIPVTTMPFLRLPMHATYILYLYKFNRKLALWYFRFSVWFCSLTGTPISLLLHPLDFIGQNDPDGLDFMPTMKMNVEDKLNCLREMINILRKYYQLADLEQQARTLLKAKDSKTKTSLRVHKTGGFFKKFAYHES